MKTRVYFQKISTPSSHPTAKEIVNSRGRGLEDSKATKFRGKYEAKVEFPQENLLAILSVEEDVGEVWIFSGAKF